MRFWLTLEISLKELVRQPMYLVTTLVFPSMFFWFFGVPNATSLEAAKILVGSFAGFAVLAVMLFQLAVQTAFERHLSWSRYLKCLPLSGAEVLAGRVLSSFLVAVLAIMCVIATGLEFTNLKHSDLPWTKFLVVLLVGGIPFSLIGLTLGYLVRNKTALPAANLVYLPLSFAGGLWLPPSALPQSVQNISVYLPTRFYRDCIESVLLHQELPTASLRGFLAYTVVFSVAVLALYRRDEKRN